MFQKILIANRGEIACRVIQTAQRMGIKTVAVYSDADAGAKHVALADEAVHIGGAKASESYLLGEKIIAACKSTGAQAIHPGYGFLSENPDFVDAVTAAGLKFIGPSADAIRAMGLKDAAKALMEQANVPVVPGYHGSNQDPDYLASEADKIGYPVLIKARAGGGGKGMRLVEDPKNFTAELASAQREAQASFGDPACLIEKYITQPRHIEIQVFGDSHGNVVHFFERDCSLQRRHQKVIEEAPAPDMPADVRTAMGKAAVDAAKAINYAGAGTVEFIVDGSNGLQTDGFWFMEMNTRLQVEHPVSEAITGYDFVELQLRIASGEALPMQQEDITLTGWSFEARLYAEDVPKGFLPATGTLSHLQFPEGGTFENTPVRIDSGVRPQDEISPWYDPMIAKVIVHGPDRSTALNMLAKALEDCHVAGCVTNLSFLHALTQHAGFAKGEVDTGLIARDLDALTSQQSMSAPVQSLAAIAALGLLPKAQPTAWDTLTGYRSWDVAQHQVTLMHDDTPVSAQVAIQAADRFTVTINGEQQDLTITTEDSTRFTLQTDQSRITANIAQTGSALSVFYQGQSHHLTIPDPLATSSEDAHTSDAITSPMPGQVKQVDVTQGQTIKKDDPLLILEAMKMEHRLAAPRDGIIAEVLCSEGDQVAQSALLIKLEPETEDDS